MGNKEKLQKIEKRIIAAEGFFIVGILLVLFFSTIPKQIYPLNGMTIVDPDFVFEIQNAEQVLLSVDKDFTNPIVLREGSDLVLPPGIYYWKVKGMFRESEVKTFTIQEHVGLNLKNRENNFEIQNAGNVGVNLTKENEQGKQEFDLEVGSSKEFEKDDSKYEGRRT